MIHTQSRIRHDIGGFSLSIHSEDPRRRFKAGRLEPKHVREMLSQAERVARWNACKKSKLTEQMIRTFGTGLQDAEKGRY